MFCLVHNLGAGLRSANMRSPSSVRSGSIRSNISVPSENSGASPPVATTLSGMPISRCDARDQPFYQPHIAPVDAGLHRRHRAAANHRLRPANADARQPGRRLVQRLDRQVDARRDGAAQIGAVGIYHVESGRGAEIDHHQRLLEQVIGRQRVQQPVRPHLRRRVHADFEAPIQRRAGNQRLHLEPVAAQAAQMIQGRRHHGADHGAAFTRSTTAWRG